MFNHTKRNEKKVHSKVSFKKAEDDSSILYEPVVLINGFGTFFIPLAHELICAMEYVSKAKFGVNVCVDEDDQWLIHGESLNSVKTYINALIEKKFSIQKTEKMVIRIISNDKLSYLVTENNAVKASDEDFMIDHQKSSYGSNARKSGSLKQPFELTNCFNMGFSACVVVRKSSALSDNLSVEYVNPIFSKDQVYGKKLNSFQNLLLSGRKGEVIELDYTEELAKLCYEAMISLCELSHATNAFISQAQSHQSLQVNNPNEMLKIA